MNKEKEIWETKGYDSYQSDKWKDPKVSDYQFDILKKKLNLKKCNILEIGVGSGRDVKKFAQEGARLSALDISSKFIVDINKELKGNFKTMDMRDIAKWPEKDLDLIYSRWSILFLKYDEFKKFLKDARTLLKPSGKIMISLRAGESLENTHKYSKMQSLQLNGSNLLKALPPGMEVEFLDIIDCATSTNPNDKQITFIISNSIYKAPRLSYIK